MPSLPTLNVPIGPSSIVAVYDATPFHFTPPRSSVHFNIFWKCSDVLGRKSSSFGQSEIQPAKFSELGPFAFLTMTCEMLCKVGDSYASPRSKSWREVLLRMASKMGAKVASVDVAIVTLMQMRNRFFSMS